MANFICYRKNILTDYGVKSVQERIEADTIIEAALVYFKKYSRWPEEIYQAEREQVSDGIVQLETLKYRMGHIEEQRDNFANSLAAVERQRETAYRQIEKLHNIVRNIINDVNERIKR